MCFEILHIQSFSSLHLLPLSPQTVPLLQPCFTCIQTFILLYIQYDPAIPLFCTYPKKCKMEYNRDTCISMFIVALFTTAKL
jgi:hypothetical protein